MGDVSDRGEIIPVEQKSKKGMLINSGTAFFQQFTSLKD